MKRRSHFSFILAEAHPLEQCIWVIWFHLCSQSKFNPTLGQTWYFIVNCTPRLILYLYHHFPHAFIHCMLVWFTKTKASNCIQIIVIYIESICNICLHGLARAEGSFILPHQNLRNHRLIVVCHPALIISTWQLAHSLFLMFFWHHSTWKCNR